MGEGDWRSSIITRNEMFPWSLLKKLQQRFQLLFRSRRRPACSFFGVAASLQGSASHTWQELKSQDASPGFTVMCRAVGEGSTGAESMLRGALRPLWKGPRRGSPHRLICRWSQRGRDLRVFSLKFLLPLEASSPWCPPTPALCRESSSSKGRVFAISPFSCLW